MYTPLENKTVGQSIAKLRKHKEIKASEVANHLHLSESACTKYERGETEIAISFLNTVAQFFQVSPLEIIGSKPENVIENIHNSNFVATNNGHFITMDKDTLNTISNQLGVKDKQIAQMQEQIGFMLRKS